MTSFKFSLSVEKLEINEKVKGKFRCRKKLQKSINKNVDLKKIGPVFFDV